MLSLQEHGPRPPGGPAAPGTQRHRPIKTPCGLYYGIYKGLLFFAGTFIRGVVLSTNNETRTADDLQTKMRIQSALKERDARVAALIVQSVSNVMGRDGRDV